MRRAVTFLFSLLLLSACAAPAGEVPPAAPEALPKAPVQTEIPVEPAPVENVPPAEADESENHILLTLDAPLADGRTLTLEAFGKTLDEYTTGVREVRVYDGADLLQTVSAREVIEDFWGHGDSVLAEEFYDYTNCWSPEECVDALDLNFDGNTDFGLFGWTANNMIPFYYWLWDAETERYQYAFTLQGASAAPDTKELVSTFRLSATQYETDYFKPDENGNLYLDRVEVADWEISGLDDRAACETWLPHPGQRLTPGASNWSCDSLLLIRRELPIREFHEDGTISNFTEIWELKDGKLQMISREEFFYDSQQ